MYLARDFVLFIALSINHVYGSYYHGPTAKPVVLHNGYLADTHEVEAAKNAHLAALAKESHNGFGGDHGHGQERSSSYGDHHGDIRYHGPTAKPVVLHDGYVADTQEVAAAKNAHLAALAKESHNGFGGDHGHGQERSSSYGDHHGDIRYHGPTAKPVVLHNGYLADTQEVAAAKNAHLAALAKESHNGFGGDHGHGQERSSSYGDHHGDIRYHGPTAKPVVLHDGYLADTHEVAAAKNAHLAALAKESHNGFGGDHGHGQERSSSYGDHHGDIRYHGPTAKPVVLHDGYLADTHEVAAAKNAHLAALAKESHNGFGGDHGHGQERSSSYGDHHGDIRYHGPTAKPVVLHNGYLADTHEVAAAKNAHLAALAKESHNGFGGDLRYGQEYGDSYGDHHGDIRYHGPTAIPHVLHDGHIADTPEVAAAKDEHFAAVAKSKVHGGYGDHYSNRYASGYGADHGHSHHVASYHGPLAKPVVLKTGYLADTSEVAAAKHHHLETLQGQYDHHY